MRSMGEGAAEAGGEAQPGARQAVLAARPAPALLRALASPPALPAGASPAHLDQPEEVQRGPDAPGVLSDAVKQAQGGGAGARQQLLLPPRCWCCGGKTPLCAAFDQTVGMPLLITISSLSRTPGQAVRGGPCPGPRFPLSD